MKNYFAFLGLLCLGLFSCEQKAPIGGAISEATAGTDINKVDKDLLALQDSMNALLKEIDQLDTAKLAMQRRLLKEISYGRGTTTQKDFQTATDLATGLVDAPPAEVLVKAPSLLVSYDTDTDSLLQVMDRMMGELTKAQKVKPYMTELDKSIHDNDNKSITLRFKYDEMAVRYNLLLEKNQEMLMKKDSSRYSKSAPKFQVENPS